MEFLKNFFNDENTIIGLCRFEMMKSDYNKNSGEINFFTNSFQTEKVFETNFRGNVLLL